jgi:hypothetical protein
MWSPSDGLKPPAFLRELKDQTGISVNMSAQQVLSYRDCDVIYSLHVGWVRDIDGGNVLDVIQNRRDHANITGLPPHDDDDLLFKEHLARELIKIARPDTSG